MSEFDDYYLIKEKGYRDGRYGQIITKVQNAGTKEETRVETFTPLESREVKHTEADVVNFHKDHNHIDDLQASPYIQAPEQS